MSESPALSTTAEDLLRVIARRGETMTGAVLVYRDSDHEIRWYRSESLKTSDAVYLLEKANLSLLSNS
jgi:hypothetical protein